jgi:hypothetical protein
MFSYLGPYFQLQFFHDQYFGESGRINPTPIVIGPLINVGQQCLIDKLEELNYLIASLQNETPVPTSAGTIIITRKKSGGRLINKLIATENKLARLRAMTGQ